LVALDSFVLPTATLGVLFGHLVVAHHRRRVLHFDVTAKPAAGWTARRVIDAFPEETASRFLARDRDKTSGERYRRADGVLGQDKPPQAVRRHRHDHPQGKETHLAVECDRAHVFRLGPARPGGSNRSARLYR
jgi:hypothetical protein